MFERSQLIGLLTVCLALTAAGCGPKAPKGSEMTQARLQASETKLAQLEERLAALEEKTGRLDGVAEGVQILLQRLEELGTQGPRRERRQPSPTAIYSMPIDGDPFIGPRLAKVTLVKGYDFYCGYCDKVRPTLTELQKIYGKDLKIVFKNFVIHDEVARLPALAACAAHRQDKFVAMFEQIWIKGLRAQVELDEGKLLAIARSLKLKEKRFLSDMHGPCEDKVQQDFESMSAVGARGTPAFFINGRFLAGALPIDRYRRVIDQELDKADRALKAGATLKSYYAGLVASGRTSL